MNGFGRRDHRRASSASPVQARHRGQTPEQSQLLDTLEADMDWRSPTPPPRTRTFSSSPRRVNGAAGYSSADESDRDEVLTVNSFSLERDIHDDDLQRTRPGRHGTNISAPPRRISGIHNTIIEAEEDDDDGYIQPQAEEPSEPGPATVSPSPPPVPSSPHAPTIPATSSQQAASQEKVSAHVQQPRRRRRRGLRLNCGNLPPFRKLLTILLLAIAGFSVHTFRDTLVDFSLSLCSKMAFPAVPSWSMPLPPAGRNMSDPRTSDLRTSDQSASDLRTVKDLKDQIGELKAYYSSLSKDVNTVKADLANAGDLTHNARPIQGHNRAPEMKAMTNFLSPATGAIVNPYRSTPTSGKQLTTVQWLYMQFISQFISQKKLANANAHVTALVPWQDVGDCWCTVPWERHDLKSQLAIKLGRAIVPEEVVVEHVPYGSSLFPEFTPRRMELWARFEGNVPHNPAASRFAWFSGAARRFFGGGSSSERKIPASSSPPPYTYTATGRFLLHETVMALLRRVYRDEPEEAYVSSLSDDQSLGTDLHYRIGRFEYDLHGRDYVQTFTLEAVIDLPGIRVNNVILRVKSNWGGNATCLYWVKLFGHL